MKRDCQKTRDHISDWISGTLPETDKRAFQDHLDICADCRTYAQALAQEDASLASHFAQIDADTAARWGRVLKAIECLHPNPRTNTISVWRGITKHRISKLAVAAAIVVATVLGVQHFTGSFGATNVVYGMTDLPMLLKDVKTLHVQSTQWLHRPDPNQPEFEEATVIPCEVWVDVPNLRTYSTSYMSWRTPDGKRGLNRVEGVHTAEYAMDIDHTEKTVRFNKVSGVQRRLAVRDQIQRYLHRITEEQLEHFVAVGQETIDGILYNIWEREDSALHPADTRKRIRCWLAPATGEVGRIYIWTQSGDARWRLGWCADTIERDIEIPESTFAFDPPDDYRYRNTLETAFEGEGLGSGWYSMGGARVCVAISLTLDDGSVVAAWHSNDLEQDQYADQSHLFQDLIPGGDLPALPMVVYGLKTIPLESYSPPERRYTGHHLAYTKKDGWYYEWALFVTEGSLPAPTGPEVTRMLCRFNLPSEQEPTVGNPLHKNLIAAEDFDDFVRAAMAELSDDGVAPAHVTYENVMALAGQIRSSTQP